jgi:predicted nucleic acid-binding protein
MRQSVYLETSVISYLTSRPNANLVIAGRQLVTTDWWDCHRHGYDLFVSLPVVDEASRGDAEAVQKRLEKIHGIPRLEITDDTVEVSKALLARNAVPETAYTDALHIALAACHNLDYLLTWNFRHIANASIMRQVDAVIESFDIEPALICTPDELMGATEETFHDD